MPDERYRIFKSELDIEEYAKYSEELFRRNMLDKHINQPNATFVKGKFLVYDKIYFASYCANYVLEVNKKDDQNNDWQPVVLDEFVNETKQFKDCYQSLYHV